MLKKLFIIPWCGNFPEWMSKYRDHIKHLSKEGYDFFITQDMDDFSKRVEITLGFTPYLEPGKSFLHNYRTAFGLLYADKLKGYDYWGITDLDCVYGNPTYFVPDQDLQEVDIWSNHHNYICGPWTIFRNTPVVNELFKQVPNWEQFMKDTQSHSGRWTEVEFSQVIDRLHEEGVIKRLYTHYQGKNPNVWENLSFKNGNLYDNGDEIMTFHFNHSKVWPL